MNDQSRFHEKTSEQDPGSLFLRALFLATLVLVSLCIVGFLIFNGVLLITGYKVEYEEILPILEKAAGWALLAVSIPILAVTAALARFMSRNENPRWLTKYWKRTLYNLAAGLITLTLFILVDRQFLTGPQVPNEMSHDLLLLATALVLVFGAAFATYVIYMGSKDARDTNEPGRLRNKN